jgi:hypothetical protein
MHPQCDSIGDRQYYFFKLSDELLQQITNILTPIYTGLLVASPHIFVLFHCTSSCSYPPLPLWFLPCGQPPLRPPYLLCPATSSSRPLPATSFPTPPPQPPSPLRFLQPPYGDLHRDLIPYSGPVISFPDLWVMSFPVISSLLSRVLCHCFQDSPVLEIVQTSFIHMKFISSHETFILFLFINTMSHQLI